MRFHRKQDGRQIPSLEDQMKAFQSFDMFASRGNEIDPGGVDGAVTQYVGQLRHVPADAVETAGEQMPQVVGEHLSGFHIGHAAQLLHFQPDLFSGQTLPASGEKDLTGGGFIFPGKCKQFSAQPGGKQNGADFSLQGNFGFPDCAASRVMQDTSLTRMPVAQIVSISRARRVFPCCRAVRTRRR